ncbi:MAG: PAS domain-containing protein [Proteobacteria bacterium]|nr:PAS domain-containing protein [Pseudomonadota bacterium]
MFKKKHMLIVGGALVFLVFIIGVLSVTFNYVKLNREWVLHEFENNIKTGSEELQFYLESLRSDLLRIDKYLANSNMKVGEELYGYLNFVMGHHPNAIPEILILDVNGKVVAGTNPASAQSSFQESKYFKNTQHIPNKVYLSEAIIVSDLLSRSEVAPKIFMDPLDLGFVLHTGVYSKGVFKGAILFVVRAEPFFNRYSMALTKLTSGYGFILEEDGRILFHRDVELRGKFLSDLSEPSDLIKANDLLRNTEGKILGYRATGQHLIVTSEVYMENQRWILGISTTTLKLAQKALSTIYTLSGLVLLLGIIVFGLVVAFMRLGEAKEALWQSEERLRVAGKAAYDLIYEWDVASDALQWFGDIDGLLGYRKGKISRDINAWLDLILPEDRVKLDNAVEIHRTSTEPIQYEYRVRHKDGTYRHWNDHGLPLLDDKGCPYKWIGVCTDITERKRAEEALQLYVEQLRSLTARLEEVEAVLRQRLAQELHDRVGQNLTALSINLNVVRSMFPAESATEVGPRLDDSLRLVEQTAEHIRDVMAELRPPVLDDYGLVAALRWYGEQFTDRTGVATVVQGEDWTPRLPASLEMALFRTVQEALTNAAKHAQASQVTVTMEQVAGGARLTIADNGDGFDPKVLDRPGKLSGWGLVSMRERAASVGGHLIVKSEPGKGTRIVVEVRR